MQVLRNEEILQRQLELSRLTDSLHIVSYNVDGRWGWMLAGRARRLVIGYPGSDMERQVRILSKCQAVASQHRSCAVRSLKDSHTKLFIAEGIPRRGTVCIVGSQNLGEGHKFELALEVEKKDATKLVAYFNSLWVLAQEVKPLDGIGLVKALSEGVFEDRRESTSPTTNRN